MSRSGLALGLAGLLAAATAAPAAAELKVGVGGYIKLDVQYGDKNTGSFPSPGPADVPLDGDRARDNGQTIIDARQSRLRATFSDELAGVKISGRIEGDFFTGDGNARVSNSRHFRLRHAFARGDHSSGFSLLAGQYWSALMNIDVAQPDLVDFNGPAGQVFARQPQLRVGYEIPVGAGRIVLEGDVEKHSLENLSEAPPPGVTASDPIDEGQGSGQDVPLFTGKVSWLSKLLSVEAAVAFAENKVTLASGSRTSETAWAGQLSAEVSLDPFRVFAHYQHLDGLNRLANNDFPGAVLLGTTLENVESDGWYVGAGVKLTKATSANAVFGWAQADRIPGAFEGGGLETHQSIHVNVLHKFWERWQVGLEYRRFDVEAFDGQEGDVNLVHGAVWYFF